jgi:hypothetical protein
MGSTQHLMIASFVVLTWPWGGVNLPRCLWVWVLSWCVSYVHTSMCDIPVILYQHAFIEDWQAWLEWYSACLVNVRSWVQTSVWLKTKQKQHVFIEQFCAGFWKYNWKRQLQVCPAGASSSTKTDLSPMTIQNGQDWDGRGTRGCRALTISNSASMMPERTSWGGEGVWAGCEGWEGEQGTEGCGERRLSSEWHAFIYWGDCVEAAMYMYRSLYSVDIRSRVSANAQCLFHHWFDCLRSSGTS